MCTRLPTKLGQRCVSHDHDHIRVCAKQFLCSASYLLRVAGSPVIIHPKVAAHRTSPASETCREKLRSDPDPHGRLSRRSRSACRSGVRVRQSACAQPAGQEAATPPISVMNSRRLIPCPSAARRAISRQLAKRTRFQALRQPPFQLPEMKIRADTQAVQKAC